MLHALGNIGDPLAGVRDGLKNVYPGIPDVLIGVVDGMPDLSHPSLQRANIECLDAMIPGSAGAPDSHGTGICSIIFGQTPELRGIAPGCSGLVLPIFFGETNDARTRPASQLDLARALAFGIERGASIINVSAGQRSFSTEAEAHLQQVLKNCVERRVLVVAAAGNDGCDCIHIPAASDCVLAVGAVAHDGSPLETSNWGRPYRLNGLLAPGKDIPVALTGNRFGRASGTSYAAAVVSGVAALLLSLARSAGYAIDAFDIRTILIDSAKRCELAKEGACDRYLAGSLDPAGALKLLHQIGSSRKPPANSALKTEVRQELVRPDHASPSMGRPEMLQSDIAPSETLSFERSGLEASACACQTKAKEQDDEQAIRPQAKSPSVTSALNKSGDGDTGVSQSACSCGGGRPPQIVYALGSLWFDFGTEARYDAIVQQLGGDPARAANPHELIGFLRAQPRFATGLTFILLQDQIPLYAIVPSGPFAADTYKDMLDAIEASIGDHGRLQRVSLPGFIGGSTRLMNGMSVPIVFADPRGMFRWRPHELLEATKSFLLNPPSPPEDAAILDFLNRVYYELRNLGVTPQERAMNFAATNAYQARQVFAEATARNYALDSIEVVKSPICRPDSDCWDVKLQMFDPENERRAGRVYRYTVDVSEVLPVTVGPVRNWAVRLGA
ncbi:PatA/PatG family cyanobactin maturation protease [Bradyrhizobium sp. SZCCHNRI3052]|uniref:PatA/PatG family cyanobactin maturation protease n=1 Tax=Bradyrhizobium sp. SZCCHNRI3052 TaxID=3057295 RepID=UPI0029165E54|nr:PatA/PatG family cyanobactin maturation protease [Bradyrhizobium sp. SZCCHNRI3052]